MKSEDYPVKIDTVISKNTGKKIVSIKDKEFGLVVYGEDNKQIGKKYDIGVSAMLIVKSLLSVKRMLMSKLYDKQKINKVAEESKKNKENLESLLEDA